MINIYPIFFFLFKIIICSFYEYETIEENILKSGEFYFPGQYKIYEYIPLCEEKKHLDNMKSVYISPFVSDLLYFYIYDNYSKIEKDEKGYLINYNKELALIDYPELEKFICKQKYYLVMSIRPYKEFPVDYKISLIDKLTDVIHLNPSLSREYRFISTSYYKALNFTYKYKENKIVLIKMYEDVYLKIYENNSLLYDHKRDERNKILKYLFKKETNYKIVFGSNHNVMRANINFQFFDENEEYIKPDFNKSSFILHSNYEYFIEVDTSKFQLHENIIFSMFGEESKTIVKYQYKNILKDNNLLNKGTLTAEGSKKFNYFQFKKTEESNLILYIKIYA